MPVKKKKTLNTSIASLKSETKRAKALHPKLKDSASEDTEVIAADAERRKRMAFEERRNNLRGSISPLGGAAVEEPPTKRKVKK